MLTAWPKNCPIAINHSPSGFCRPRGRPSHRSWPRPSSAPRPVCEMEKLAPVRRVHIKEWLAFAQFEPDRCRSRLPESSNRDLELPSALVNTQRLGRCPNRAGEQPCVDPFDMLIPIFTVFQPRNKGKGVACDTGSAKLSSTSCEICGSNARCGHSVHQRPRLVWMC